MDYKGWGKKNRTETGRPDPTQARLGPSLGQSQANPGPNLKSTQIRNRARLEIKTKCIAHPSPGQMPDTRHQTPDTRYQIPSAKCQGQAAASDSRSIATRMAPESCVSQSASMIPSSRVWPGPEVEGEAGSEDMEEAETGAEGETGERTGPGSSVPSRVSTEVIASSRAPGS